ncbi:acyl-CoA-binding protein [Helicostylum pulchrum]|uniref:ACB domain-containing protein n=1 Tax=Helicostylum pulchrum TaxID=562976 RepID=A0ABP9XW73_9FUNG|nr:acyl-CoA-binding protein [Helicostylum pulchrum]
MPSAEFNTAAEEAQKLTVKPSNDDLLKLYALFKQATVGDNTTSKPTFDIKGRYKWDAWTAVKGTSQEDAEKQYVAFVESLKAKQ